VNSIEVVLSKIRMRESWFRVSWNIY